MTMPLVGEDRRYIIQLMKLIRQATQTASAASADWEAMNLDLNIKMDRDGLTDPLLRSKTKEANLILQSAFSKAKFWQQEVIRLCAALQAEKAGREMMLWGTYGA